VNQRAVPSAVQESLARKKYEMTDSMDFRLLRERAERGH
jgi:hypothetical protein